MTNLFAEVELQVDKNIFQAVIEIPKSSRVKYEYDHENGVMMVDRVFRTPVDYPQNYGFFPQTWNKHDGDPMDVIVVTSEQFYPGVVVPVRVVGIIEMEDTGEIDHKIIAVPDGHSDYSHINEMSELDSELMANITWFLEHYKGREPGKKVIITGSKDSQEAMRFLQECSDEYQQNQAKK